MGHMVVRLIGIVIACVIARSGHAEEMPPKEDPICTLSHGGQLRGRSATWQNQPVDVFTGIRFAEAPTGDRRFKKPVEHPSWTGEVEAKTVGNMCLQYDMLGQVVGDEDCLFLHVTVPGETRAGQKKPVMVWIHGGGFNAGASSGYIGAPLALNGDVIVVTINYRLGIMGFLSDGPGTGNFGLWDQIEALRWVQSNIEAFGGDPQQVTIFGESAGASSVSALTLSHHTDGLFNRAIQQSGTLFLLWSWYKSENDRYALTQQIRNVTNCENAAEDSVYDCFNGMSGPEVLSSVPVEDSFNPPFGPTADEDFFPASVDTDGYELAKRFDLMCGVNGQEGVTQMYFSVGGFAAMKNETIENGVSLALAKEFLHFMCSTQYSKQAPQLCVEHIVYTYRLDKAKNDIQRARRLSFFLGEFLYDVGALETLLAHSTGNKSTYAYYFGEMYEPQTQFIQIPGWLRRSADHTQELPFLFGAAFLEDETDGIWIELIETDWLATLLFNQTLTTLYQDLSQRMMTMWTNFAKSGNPNSPVCPSGRSIVWPEFDSDSESFVEIRDWYSKVIPTPNKDRLMKLQNGLVAARNTQYLADSAPCCPCSS